MSQVVSGSSANARPRLNIYGYNCIGKHIGLVVVVCAPLFIGAGTLRWDWAWLFTVITFIGWVALSIILIFTNPELLNERGKRVKDLTGTKRWDWIVMTIYSILLVAVPLIAGLDYRYAWSSPTADGIKIVGLAVLVFSFIPLTWSMAVNRFFEATVRIQENRGHQVITSGPYRYVRHPGYVGVILQFIAVPLSLGTFAPWIPALLGVALYALRTALEDRTLTAELPGYAEYAQRTHYRLLPGVW
jgi:protein-S-isoprenylcysteine O-methyltransferase Ste14